MQETQQSGDYCCTSGNNKKNDECRLEPHVCRECFARLVSFPVGGGLRRYFCPNCGAEAEATSADELCCCGIKIRKPGRSGKAAVLVDAGVRCIPNPDPTPLFPSLYVASEVAK